MTVAELKKILAAVPDHYTVIVPESFGPTEEAQWLFSADREDLLLVADRWPENRDAFALVPPVPQANPPAGRRGRQLRAGSAADYDYDQIDDLPDCLI